MPYHDVKDGDCVLSICAKLGLKWDKVWGLPENAELKAKRKYPTILKPGDKLFYPEHEAKTADRPTDQRHKFKISATPAKLRLRLLHKGKPVAKTGYTLDTDGADALHMTGTTDDDGRIEHDIPPTTGTVRLRIDGSGDEHALKLGWLDPIDSTSGLQARLNNLGFNCGKVDDDYGGKTRGGMQAFQRAKTIPKTSKPDKTTQDRLETEYGC